MFIAWDLETCPLPRDALTEAGRQRLEQQMEAAGVAGLDPEHAEALKVRSLHPMLGWICCLSVVAATDPGEPRTPRSYVATSPEGELELLRAFWSDLERLGNRSVTWITFNGKRFDVEFLLSRSLYHGLYPTRTDLLDQYPYSFSPHCDLMTIWRRSAMRLEDACELLGVESPKKEMDGSGVCEAVADGRLDDVRRYCEADVLATMACFARVAPIFHAGSRRRMHFATG